MSGKKVLYSVRAAGKIAKLQDDGTVLIGDSEDSLTEHFFFTHPKSGLGLAIDERAFQDLVAMGIESGDYDPPPAPAALTYEKTGQEPMSVSTDANSLSLLAFEALMEVASRGPAITTTPSLVARTLYVSNWKNLFDDAPWFEEFQTMETIFFRIVPGSAPDDCLMKYFGDV